MDGGPGRHPRPGGRRPGPRRLRGQLSGTTRPRSTRAERECRLQCRDNLVGRRTERPARIQNPSAHGATPKGLIAACRRSRQTFPADAEGVSRREPAGLTPAARKDCAASSLGRAAVSPNSAARLSKLTVRLGNPFRWVRRSQFIACEETRIDASDRARLAIWRWPICLIEMSHQFL